MIPIDLSASAVTQAVDISIDIALLALLALLILISAFFSASEVAFLSISLVKMQSLLERRARNAGRLARLRAHRHRTIIALLIGGSVANVAASALVTRICIDLLGDAGVGVAVGVASFLLLTFGDIIPKSAATTYSERMALAFAPLIELFYYFSLPLVMVFEFITRLIPGVYSTATGIEHFTEAEVRSAVNLGAAHQGISERERILIENVLEFNDRPVSRAMTPKSSVVALPADMPVTEAHRKAIWTHYSRFPVLGPHKEIVGTLSVKMLGQAVYEHPQWTVRQACMKPILVRRDEKLHNAFSLLQSQGRNIALVVDEKGAFVGVVTLEDLLEELVGEIK